MSGKLASVKIHTEPNIFHPKILNKFLICYEPGSILANKFKFENRKEHQEFLEKIKKFFYKKKMYNVDDFETGMHIKTLKQVSVVYNGYSGKFKKLDLAKILIKDKFYYFDINDVVFVM